jgi:hypothetical protein
MSLSVVHEHYLKRELIRLEIDQEVARLDDFKTIGQFGYPFVLHPDGKAVKGKSRKDENQEKCYAPGFPEFPLLRHVFVNCVMTFPFLGTADEAFWQQRVQPFVESFAEKDISSTADREEATKRQRIGMKIKRLILIYAASGLHTTRPGEHDVKVHSIGQKGVEEINPGEIARMSIQDNFVNGYEVTVEGVRPVSLRRGFLYEKNWQYLIKAQMKGAPCVHVARLYSEFQDLDKKLHKEFPGKLLPKLPSKHKAGITIAEEESEDSKLPREHQRITLRAYVKALLEVPNVTSCQPVLEFLFKDRVTLTPADYQDIALRKKMDLLRTEDQVRFFELAKLRARKLEEYISEFKTELLKENGLANIFQELKEKSRVEELSPKFQKFVEWALIEFSATLYHIFVAQDNSPEYFSQVRRVHSMMPYTVLRGILRLSNPVAIMKGITDLFLAQPFGARSLLQNMLLVVLADDIKEQDKEIAELAAKLPHPQIVNVLEAYVSAKPEVHAYIQEMCIKTGDDLVVVIFRCSEILECEVTRSMIIGVEKWYKTKDSQDSYFPILKDLYTVVTRKRDKDMLQQLWADDVTVRLIKDLIGIFYAPLIRVFKSAKIHESVGDFERFMSDLVSVVSKVESETIGASDPNKSVQQFIDLCRRHQNSVIKFVHEVYTHDDGLFDGTVGWMSSIIEFLRNGPHMPLDVVGLVEKSDVDVGKIVKEMEAIQAWIEEKRAWRDRVVDVPKTTDADWSAAMPAGAIEGNDFGLSMDDLEELDDEDDDRQNEHGESTKAPQRPELVETPKLSDGFHDNLVAILSG